MSGLSAALLAAGNALFDSPFNYLWPLIAAPALAAWISDRTARLLPRRPGAWPAAAMLAAAPGLVGLGVICQAMDLGPVVTWRGVVDHWLTPLLAATLAAYALVRAGQRQVEVARLFVAAAPPGERLARAAARFGLVARELPTAERECFVAGVIHPTVFVSRGAIDQLNDEELAAALAHERAHVRARDTLSLLVLSILRDLAPLGRGLALDAFRAAREAAADRAAAAEAGPLTLAGALLALARRGAGAAPAAALPMARRDSLRWRMQALLESEGEAPVPGRLWAEVAPGLATSALLVAWPLLQFELMLLFCNGGG